MKCSGERTSREIYGSCASGALNSKDVLHFASTSKLTNSCWRSILGCAGVGRIENPPTSSSYPQCSLKLVSLPRRPRTRKAKVHSVSPTYGVLTNTVRYTLDEANSILAMTQYQNQKTIRVCSIQILILRRGSRCDQQIQQEKKEHKNTSIESKD